MELDLGLKFKSAAAGRTAQLANGRKSNESLVETAHGPTSIIHLTRASVARTYASLIVEHIAGQPLHHPVRNGFSSPPSAHAACPATPCPHLDSSRVPPAAPPTAGAATSTLPDHFSAGNSASTAAENRRWCERSSESAGA
jgi:hypothetical protein